MDRTAQSAALVASGLLAGNELGTLIGSHPALRALPQEAEMEAERALTAHLGRVMPAYMTLALTTAVVAAVDRRGEPGARLAAAAAAATGAMLAITLRGNLPLNAQTASYPPGGDAAGWQELRRRWRRLHVVRVVLDLAAFGAWSSLALRRP